MNDLFFNVIIFSGTMIFIYVLMLVLFGDNVKSQIVKRSERIDKRSNGQLSTGKKNEIGESLKKDKSDSSIASFDKLIKKLPNLDQLRYRLEMSGIRIKAGRYLLLCVSASFIAAFVMTIFVGINLIIAAPIAVIIGIGFPHFVISYLISKKANVFVSLFPDAIELIVRGLRSGLPVQESFKVISEEIAEPIKSEFEKIAQSIKLGMPVETALVEAAGRLKLLEFDFFVTSLNLQRETGGNLAEILSNLANTIRNRHMLKMKIKAMSSEARASAWIVGALPFGVIGALYFINPEYLEPLFYDVRGNIALVIAAASMSFGMFVMKKMANFDV